MKQNTKKNNKIQGNTKEVRGWKPRLLPLQFVLIVLPLILYFYPSNSGYSIYPWNTEDDSYLDIFLQGKMIAFMIVAGIMLVLLVMRLVKMNAQDRKSFLVTFSPLLAYLFFVVLSTVCSKNFMVSLTGAMEQKEPAGVLIGYVVVALYTFLVIETKNDLDQIIEAACIGSIIMAVLGVLQAVGLDPFATESGQMLFAREYVSNYGLLSLTFPKGQAYGTLHNPNYVGSYVPMYVPLLLAGTLVFKSWWKKLISLFALLGLMIMLFASQSRTGLIAIMAAGIVMVVFLGKALVKRWYLVIPGVTFLVMSFLLLDTYRDNLLTNRLKAMIQIEKSQDALHAIDTTGNGVRVSYKDTEFTVMMAISGNDFAYLAKEGEESKEITYNEDKTYGYFSLNDGEQIAIQTAIFEDVYAFGLYLDNRNYYFTNQSVVGNYKYINEYGRVDECVMADNVFPGYEAVASGRGYAWGRSIPLLWKHFFIGSGPDTFAITFPQNDYVARYKSGFGNTIFTRPHNLYLQMGVQTGTLSLVAFLAFYLSYALGCCKRYWFRKISTPMEWLGLGIFLGTVGFMVAGMANDSLLVVTPMFYTLLGTGMAINHKLCPLPKKEKKSKNIEAREDEQKGLE